RRGELQLPWRVEHRSAQPRVTSRGDGAERSRENLAHRFSGGANLLSLRCGATSSVSLTAHKIVRASSSGSTETWGLGYQSWLAPRVARETERASARNSGAGGQD